MSILDAARSAYRAGLCLLPTRDDGSKAPDVASWTPFTITRPTFEQMRAWDFAHRSGFGLVGGAVSQFVDPWDFDDLEVFEAYVLRADEWGLADVVQRLRSGFEVTTPSDGRRWLCHYPPELTFEDVALARRPGRAGEPKIKNLIELTTFSVLAPSNGGTHPSGRAYVQVAGTFDTIPSYTADERDALFSLARSFDQMPRVEARRATAGTGDRPGDAYNQRTTWPAVLEAHGWTHIYDRGDVVYWRRPGKTHGASASTNFGGTNLFFPFTSSTVFEPDKSYSKFGVFAVLEHGGDFARAARALADRGYGKTSRPTRERPRPVETTASAATAEWRWLASVERQQVDWLWRSRLARGTLALWIGDGGLGKSRASNDLAARITTGAAWPDGDAAPLGTVIVLSAEDDASCTIRPAIEAAGGDVERVAILDAVRDATGTERTFNLGTDLAALEELLVATKASLVIIDPLSAYLGTALDSYRDTDVRSVLEPICKLAARQQVAVLGIMHIGKGGDRNARHRALGSVGFVNAARLVFAIGPDPEDDSRRLLVPVKANLCREAPTLAFRLEDAGDVARVVWESAPVAGMTANAVLNGAAGDDDEQRGAVDLLRQLLDEEIWPLSATAVAAAGRAHGVHVRSLRRAAHRLGLVIKKSSFRNGWFWFRPVAEGDTSAPTEQAAKKPTSEGDEGASVSPVSPSADLSPSSAPKGTVSPSSPSSNIQQIYTRGEGDSRESTRAREAADSDDLPACLIDLAAPDASEPIGEHDEEPDDGRSLTARKQDAGDALFKRGWR